VIAGGFAVCALASSGDKSAEEQMTEVLERLGKVLEASGSTKTNLVSLMVFVKDASTNAVAVNGVLDGWVDPKEAPTRAVVELGHRSSQGGLIELHAMARVA
jgi:enamine deaminase RidA (YjgF/YER057c/UK114 family)